MRKNRHPADVAILILLNAKLYEDERKRDVARYRFSAETLRRLSGRRLIRGAFIKQLRQEFQNLDWFLLEQGADFAVVSEANVDVWVKLGPKRLYEAGYTKLQGDELACLYEKLYPSLPDSEDEEIES